MKMDKECLASLVKIKADEIATLLDKGKDVEIRTSKEGIAVIEITKKVIK